MKTSLSKLKDKDTFLNFIKELDIEKNNCTIIGDSIKSDIIPGLEAGIDVIHYNYTHEHYEWIQDKEETDLKFISVNDLLQIKSLYKRDFFFKFDLFWAYLVILHSWPQC